MDLNTSEVITLISVALIIISPILLVVIRNIKIQTEEFRREFKKFEFSVNLTAMKPKELIDLLNRTQDTEDKEEIIKLMKKKWNFTDDSIRKVMKLGK